MDMNIDFIVDGTVFDFATVEVASEITVPNTLVGILQQMSAYTPPVEVEEIVEVVKKTRGRPRKVKQVEGAFKHVQSEDGPEGRSISFAEQRDMEREFHLEMSRYSDLSTTQILTSLAKKYELSYKQAHSLLMK